MEPPTLAACLTALISVSVTIIPPGGNFEVMVTVTEIPPDGITLSAEAFCFSA